MKGVKKTYRKKKKNLARVIRTCQMTGLGGRWRKRLKCRPERDYIGDFLISMQDAATKQMACQRKMGRRSLRP